MKVLVVDDEPLVRRSIERIFQTHQHEVVSAENGSDGLKKWLECKPDLVFLDVLMPGLTGPEVLKAYKAEGSGHSKIILMSAFTGDKQMTDPKILGADLFIAKPFDSIFEIYEKAMGLMK